MSYQSQSPWGVLGTRTNAATDPFMAAQVGKLDYTVGLQPLYLADGRMVNMRQAVTRLDTSAILGTVGPRYTPIQNADGFGILTDVCNKYGFSIETVGTFDGGARAWMLIKMAESMEVTHGDTVRGYFLLTLAHDGSGAFIAKLTPIRVVCKNTLSAAIATGDNLVSIRHTASAPQRIIEAQRLVESMVHAMHTTQTTFAAMAAKRMSRADILSFIESVIPTPKDEKPSTQLTNKRSAILDLTLNGLGADLAGANRRDGSTSIWGVYNAFTEYIDHVRPGTSKNTQAANLSALFGSGADLKALALLNARKLLAV
jgi:phage/plasmid-like protein (TIGR03299 family)